MLSDIKTLDDAVWDVWFYRTSVGWWLEAEGCDGVDEVNAAVFAFMMGHETDNPSAFALMVVPTGTQPGNYKPMQMPKR